MGSLLNFGTANLQFKRVMKPVRKSQFSLSHVNQSSDDYRGFDNSGYKVYNHYNVVMTHKGEDPMSQVVSLRLADATAERLKISARRTGRSVNEAAARSIEEWLRQEEFTDIEFRSFNGERHACLKGALPVWQLIMVAKDYGMEAEKTAVHFRWPVHRIKAVLNYYEGYPEEIDQAIADNDAMTFDKLKRLLPQLEALSVPKTVQDGESP